MFDLPQVQAIVAITMISIVAITVIAVVAVPVMAMIAFLIFTLLFLLFVNYVTSNKHASINRGTVSSIGWDCVLDSANETEAADPVALTILESFCGRQRAARRRIGFAKYRSQQLDFIGVRIAQPYDVGKSQRSTDEI